MKLLQKFLATLGVPEEEIQQALAPVPKALAGSSAGQDETVAAKVNETPSQVYLLLDVSGSMSDGDKLAQARKGGRRFAADAIRRDYNVGVIRFSDDAEVAVFPTKHIFEIDSALAREDGGGRTNMAAAIELATERLASRDGERAIVLVTDGFPDDQAETLAAAGAAKRRGITIIAIGTDDADREFLARLASATELARKVSREELHVAITDAARLLPAKASR